MSKEIMQDNIVPFDDNDVFVLSKWGCLSNVLVDYGVDVSRVTGKIGEHIVEDFMELMVKCGYIKKGEDDDI